MGPEPVGVYWRRRGLALGALLLVLILIWALFLRGGDEPRVRPVDTTTSPSASPSGDEGSVSPQPSGSATTTSAGDSPTPTSGSSDAQPASCPDSAISVTATTDSATYAAGSTPRLTMVITNSGTDACTRDVGPAANTVAITSGGVPVWSSDDCSPGGKNSVVTLQPGSTAQVTVTWPGRLTQGSCPSDPPLAKTGTYDLTGRNGDVTSKKTAFTLT